MADRRGELDALVEKARADARASGLPGEADFDLAWLVRRLEGAGVPELLDERDRMRAIGDRMQSAAARVDAFVTDRFDLGHLPYEVGMASVELDSAVKDWTAVRAASSNIDKEGDAEHGD